MAKKSNAAAQTDLMMDGETPFATHTLRWFLTFKPGTGESRNDKFDWNRVSLESLRIKVIPPAGDEATPLEFRKFLQAAEYVRNDIVRRLDVVSKRDVTAGRNDVRGWGARPPEIQRYIEILREVHNRQQRDGRLASDSDVLSVGELSKLAACTPKEIDELEVRGLISPKRTQGGQRRFSMSDVSNVRDLAAVLRSGATGQKNAQHEEVKDDLTNATRAGRRELRAMTVEVVSHLYKEACARFPNRDKSVVSYIREHMEWLSEDEVITVIRLAREHSNDFPLYRRGRIPTNQKRISSPWVVQETEFDLT